MCVHVQKPVCVCPACPWFSLCTCARKITMPDVLMIVAMETSFCSERKMSRVRAGGGEREWRGGGLVNLVARTEIYFSWGSCCDGGSSRIQSNIFWLKVPDLSWLMTGVVNQHQTQCCVCLFTVALIILCVCVCVCVCFFLSLLCLLWVCVCEWRRVCVALWCSSKCSMISERLNDTNLM